MKWLFYVIVFVYMCYRAVYGAKSIEAGISVEPVIYGENDFWKVGSHKTINCKASSRNQKVEWFDPLGRVIKRVPGSRVFAQEHFVPSPRGSRTPALVLSFGNLLVSDTGVYQCRSGELTQDATVCVIEPSDFVNTPSEVNADLGRSITLTCQARGNPEPRLQWTKNGETISDDDSSTKYRVMTKYNSQGFEGLLTIISLDADDSGVYSCESIQETPMLEECSHKKEFNITLQVNFPPSFEDGNDTKIVYGKNNQGVKLVCSAGGYPTPSYTWFKENEENLIEFDKKQIVFNEEDNQAVLALTAGTSTYGQKYLCKASNKYGTSEKMFTVYKMDKPRKPSEINAQKATVHQIEFNIIWYGEVLFPVDAFDVQYIEVEPGNRISSKQLDWKKSDEVEVSVAIDDVTSVDLELEGLTVILSELSEETEYWVRFRAKNEAGESLWSNPVLASTIAKIEVETEEVEENEEMTEIATFVEMESTDGMFYGIFFAGGIIVVAVACMFFMRLV